MFNLVRFVPGQLAIRPGRLQLIDHSLIQFFDDVNRDLVCNEQSLT